LRIRKQTCKRKTKHSTEREAYAALHKLRRDPDCNDPRALNVYRCVCGYFHVGHRPAQMVK
jgi:hypothetical protein